MLDAPTRKLTSIGTAVLAVAFLAGCGEGGTSGKGATGAAGDYALTTFLVTQGGATRNFKSQGASLQLTLAGGGKVHGKLSLPGGAPDGSDVSQDLSGSWKANKADGTITFDFDGNPPYLNEVPFKSTGSQLSAQASPASDSTTVVSITLTKSM